MMKKIGYNDSVEMLVEILPNKYAVDIQAALESIFLGLVEPRRAQRTLSDFLYFIVEQGLQIESSSELSLLFHSYQEAELTESENNIVTITSDMSALRNTIIKLQRGSIFPSGHIAPLLQAQVDLFRDAESDVKKVLGGLVLPTEFEDTEIPLTMRLNVPADEFLESLVSNIRRHRNTLLHIARRYLKDASDRQTYANNAFDTIPSDLFDNPDNLSETKNIKGQHYSLFSKSLGERGKMNLIAYLHYKHDGLVTRDFIGGNNHVYRFGGSLQLREYFGLSALSAVAAQIIIIIETGINVSSLRNLKISANGNLKDTFRLTELGFNIIYDKLRAASKPNKKMLFIDDSTINSDFAFKYLLGATKRHRELASDDDKYLFIHQTMQSEKTVCRMSDSPFKQGFSGLLLQARKELISSPEWCKHITTDDIDELLKHSPNAKQVRTSEGILRWYDSGGDTIAAAEYLGNSESVAIRNYIPSELQDALYTHQIAKFQYLLLAAATNGKAHQADVLNLKIKTKKSEKNYLTDYIAQLDILHPNWRHFSENKEGVSDSNKNNETMISMIFTKEVIVDLFNAFKKEDDNLKNGLATDENTELLSDVFKNMISYVNAYGKGSQRRLIQEVILEGKVC